MIFPTGLQVGPEDTAEEGYQPRNDKDKYNYELCRPWLSPLHFPNAHHVTDKPETFVGAPISLQLVGRRYEDEKVIEAMEIMLKAAGPLATNI